MAACQTTDLAGNTLCVGRPQEQPCDNCPAVTFGQRVQLDRRREWAAALRYAADSTNCLDDSDLLCDLADQIEAGATPWAPANPPEPAQERPADPGAGGDTPDSATAESGGPGWDRDWVDGLAASVELGGEVLIGREDIAQLRDLRADRDRLARDVDRYRPLWSDPLTRPERWTAEPNPHPRGYLSTHEVLEDYDGAIRCASDWPPHKRHAALDHTMGHVRPLVYEIEHLREDRERLTADRDAARAEADQLRAQLEEGA